MRYSSTRLADLRGPTYIMAMIRVAITPAAFDAVTSTLPVGSVGFEAEPNAQGERLI
jgi:hypothetical protein